MNDTVYDVISTLEEKQAECFGSYNKKHPLCSNYCVLRLRCAIEQDKNIRSQVLEELFDFEKMSVKMQ